VLKVREGLGADDYADPGWFEHPPSTVAHAADMGAAPSPTPAAPPTGHEHHH
jgi:hypothetical protein